MSPPIHDQTISLPFLPSAATSSSFTTKSSAMAAPTNNKPWPINLSSPPSKHPRQSSSPFQPWSEGSSSRVAPVTPSSSSKPQLQQRLLTPTPAPWPFFSHSIIATHRQPAPLSLTPRETPFHGSSSAACSCSFTATSFSFSSDREHHSNEHSCTVDHQQPCREPYPHHRERPPLTSTTTGDSLRPSNPASPSFFPW